MELVQEEEIEQGIKTGRYVRGYKMARKSDPRNGEQFETTQKEIFGICKLCARQAAGRPDKTEPGAAQSRRIQERLALIRERRTDLTTEQAARAAVEDEFDPHNEPNPAFRAWLLEHGERDKSRDAEIAETFGEGPHAGGAA